MTTQLPAFATPVPTIEVTVAHWLEAFRLSEPRRRVFLYPQFPLVFSCSTNGIWPTTEFGPIKEDGRTYVQGQCELLDRIAFLYMASADTDQGGRFTLTLAGAFRTRDGAPIVAFSLCA